MESKSLINALLASALSKVVDYICRQFIKMKAIYLFGLKKLGESFINPHQINREILRKAMGIKVPDYTLKGMPLVNNIRSGRAISQAFNDKRGGVKVVVAPPGSGKTTRIRSSMNTFIDSGGKARMLAG